MHHSRAIRFLQPFTATRVIKGQFALATHEGKFRKAYAFGVCENKYTKDQVVGVRQIKDEALLIVTSNPLSGEVVLDDAVEGRDFEFLSHQVVK